MYKPKNFYPEDYRFDTRHKDINSILSEYKQLILSEYNNYLHSITSQNITLLIDLILARLPLPYVYIDKRNTKFIYGKEIVLTTYCFINNSLPLINSKYPTIKEEAYFSDLSLQYQRRILETNIPIIKCYLYEPTGYPIKEKVELFKSIYLSI